jgi:hypothetical protein
MLSRCYKVASSVDSALANKIVRIRYAPSGNHRTLVSASTSWSALTFKENGEPLDVLQEKQFGQDKVNEGQVLVRMLAAPVNPR